MTLRSDEKEKRREKKGKEEEEELIGKQDSPFSHVDSHVSSKDAFFSGAVGTIIRGI